MRNRIERINAELKKQLAPIINEELSDPRIKGMISIVKVDCDSDLSVCKVYLSVLGADGEEKQVVDAIQNGQGYIKNILKKRIILRSLPELRFYLDDSITYGIKISQILNDINTKTNE